MSRRPLLQLGLLGEHADRNADLMLADDLRESGECPPEQRDEHGRIRCWRLSCPEHLRYHLRGGDRGDLAGGEDDREEMAASLVAMPWHCSRDWWSAHPDGATQQEIGEALGISRQAVQDLLRSARRNLQGLSTGAVLSDVLDGMEDVRQGQGRPW